QTALEMAHALERCDGVESNAMVAAWLERLLSAGVVEAEPMFESSSDIRLVRGYEPEPIELDDEGGWDALTGGDVVELPPLANLQVGRQTIDVRVDELIAEDNQLRASDSREIAIAGLPRRGRWGRRFLTLLLLGTAGVTLYLYRDHLPPRATQWV